MRLSNGPLFIERRIGMKMTMLEQEVKMLKEANEYIRIRLYQDERNIEKIITQLDRLVDLVKTMMERR